MTNNFPRFYCCCPCCCCCCCLPLLRRCWCYSGCCLFKFSFSTQQYNRCVGWKGSKVVQASNKDRVRETKGQWWRRQRRQRRKEPAQYPRNNLIKDKSKHGHSNNSEAKIAFGIYQRTTGVPLIHSLFFVSLPLALSFWLVSDSPIYSAVVAVWRQQESIPMNFVYTRPLQKQWHTHSSTIGFGFSFGYHHREYPRSPSLSLVANSNLIGNPFEKILPYRDARCWVEFPTLKCMRMKIASFSR